ncbi:MAG: hypothetical protein HY904_03960 [Deltaproteobacteria bacterium]|nr:hypothetical protein [Deltaproteobacteria bacterium]
MIEHILRESIPPFRAFLEEPTPAMFRRAMAAFLEIMDDEEKHSGPDGAWKAFKLANVSLPVNKNTVKGWATGKMPEDPVALVESILAHFHKQGIVYRSSGKKAVDQAFGKPMTSTSAAAAAAALEHSPFNPPRTNAGAPEAAAVPTSAEQDAAADLQHRMAALPYTDLMDGALRWQGDPQVPPALFSQYLRATRDRLPPDAIERVMAPLGVGAHYFQRWCLLAEGRPSPDTAWPDPMFQARVMRQYLAFFLVVELNLPAQNQQQYAYRLYGALFLLSPDDVERACLLARSREPAPGAWSGITPDLLRSWAATPPAITWDIPLLEAIQAALAEALYTRFREARW